MEYRQLGRSGLRVSPFCLGMMVGYNDPDDAEAIKRIQEAIDSGVNFFDTADVYGSSEETLGNALELGGLRDRAVIGTKFGAWTGKGPNDFGNSRKHIIEACERSLRRLRTDYIDLYVAHMVDPNTPLEELLRALDTLVQQGKVRYIGTSKHPISLVVESLGLSDRLGIERMVCEQTVYNILDRRLENEFVPTCIKHGVGLTPIFPLASGVLSGKYRIGEQGPEGSRFAGKVSADSVGWAYNEAALRVAERLAAIADDKGCSLAEFCLAWTLNQPGITSPVLGVRTLEHLHSAIRACELTITDDDERRVDEIVPPGTYVCDYYHAIVQRPLQDRYAYEWAEHPDSSRIGAFIRDQRPDHDKTWGPVSKMMT